MQRLAFVIIVNNHERSFLASILSFQTTLSKAILCDYHYQSFVHFCEILQSLRNGAKASSFCNVDELKAFFVPQNFGFARQRNVSFATVQNIREDHSLGKVSTQKNIYKVI